MVRVFPNQRTSQRDVKPLTIQIFEYSGSVRFRRFLSGVSLPIYSDKWYFPAFRSVLFCYEQGKSTSSGLAQNVVHNCQLKFSENLRFNLPSNRHNRDLWLNESTVFIPVEVFLKKGFRDPRWKRHLNLTMILPATTCEGTRGRRNILQQLRGCL